MSIIYGILNENRYRDEETGYTKFSLCVNKTEGITISNNKILCEGRIPHYKPNTPLRVEGEWNQSQIFKVNKISVYSENPSVIANFICNNCSGFGEKLSMSIAAEFKGRLFELTEVPDGANQLAERIKGISLKKANALIENLKSTLKQQSIFELASIYDISYVSLMKLNKLYGEHMDRPLQKNPYKVGRILNLAFRDVESIAYYYKFEPLSKIRLDGLVYQALSQIANNGHTIAKISEVYEIVDDLSYKDSKYHIHVPKLLIYMSILGSHLFKYDDSNPTMVSLSYLDEAENIIVSELKRLTKKGVSFTYDKCLIEDYEQLNNITLEEKQKECLQSLNTPGIKIITGGPGTGKTTVVKALLHLFKNSYPEKSFVLCSPTGRASQRMSETTGEHASTIHKVIDCKPFQNTFTSREHSNPIEADLLIVDEMSMVDVELFGMLLKAVRNNTIVILIGDVNQLPSVGPGAVLKDLIDSQCFETYKLNVCKRQAENNMIIQNANKIIEGSTDLISAPEFQIFRKNSIEEIHQDIIEMHSKLYNKHNQLSVQILSSTKKYEAGTYSLNEHAQESVNNEYSCFYFGNRQFKLHDKIIMLVNNSDYGYNNGDIGEIVHIGDTQFQVSINNTILTLDKGCASEMLLAYAVTAHKSQGSEYDSVIIAIPKKPSVLLTRKVLFTEITRAKNNVMIYPEGNALEMAIKNNIDESRMTLLKEKILHSFGHDA